jgi:hypothetical protein
MTTRLAFSEQYHRVLLVVFVRSMINDRFVSNFEGTAEQNLRGKAVSFGISKTLISLTWNFDEFV